VITEHRNMLIKDAVEMIARSYASYCRHHQTKQSSSNAVRSASESAPSPAPSTATTSSLTTISERLQPDKATRRLIGLLSADCELTFDELERIISYLKFRQKVIVSTKGLLVNRSPDAGASTSTQHSYSSDTHQQSSDATTATTTGSVPALDVQFVSSLLLEAVKLASSRQ